MSARVLVLRGGPDRERPVSLVSGEAVAAALENAGFDVADKIIDAPGQREIDAMLAETEPDAVFPVLHGPFGEGGPLQRMLEHAGVAFVGSGSVASERAMDKRRTKDAVRPALDDHPAVVLADDTPLVDAAGDPPLGLPCVLKPIADGSSVSTTICRSIEQWRAALAAIDRDPREYMVERVAEGREVTVGVIDRGSGFEALPLVEICPAEGPYDYAAKYQRGDTRYIVEPELPEGLTERLQAAASDFAHRLGVRHLSRLDFIVCGDGRGVFLEINTMPGFTPTSLLPKAAARAGISFEDLCAALLRRAIEDR